MMDAQKAANELTVIRQLMERPVRYSTASGLSGLFAGLAALAGAWFDYHITPRIAQVLYDADPETLASAEDWEFIVAAGVWAAVFGVAFLATIILTRIRERKQGMPFWSPVKWKILRTIALPFLACVGLTFAMYYRWTLPHAFPQWHLAPSIWMLFYGVALWQLGEFSIREIRLLGVAFVLAGIATAACLQDYPFQCLAATFGGFHIVYGVIVWMRHGG